MRGIETFNGLGASVAVLAPRTFIPGAVRPWRATRSRKAPGHQALGDLGRVFCSEIDSVVDRILAAAQEAVRVRGDSVRKHPDVVSAMLFVTRMQKTFSAPLVGEACTTAVRDANDHVAAINRIIKGGWFDSGGGNPVDDPGYVPSEEGGPFDVLNKVRTIAIAGAVIAGVVLLAPIVFQGTSLLKALKR